MSVFFQKILALFMAVGTFFAGLFGLDKPIDIYSQYDLPAFSAGGNVVTLDENSIEKPEINKGKDVNLMQGSLLINDSEVLSKIIEEQKEHDMKDLELLWKGTVENNQVIEFALKKLATPESQ